MIKEIDRKVTGKLITEELKEKNIYAKEICDYSNIHSEISYINGKECKLCLYKKLCIT